MEFLSQRGVPFTARNIRQDPGAIEELIALGSRVTPTTVIDGEVISGFDRKRLSEMLGI